MSATEIKFGGFGGQGVILAGIIIGRAASIYDNKFATLTQSFGPEARGSACSAQVIVANEKILYPYVTRPEMLLVMSQEACNKFLPEVTDDATIIIEEDLVKPQGLKPGMKLPGIVTKARVCASGSDDDQDGAALWPPAGAADSFARPKSRTLTIPSSRSMMFSGLMSR